MYGRGGPVSAETLAGIEVPPLQNRNGQLVHDYLTRGLNPEGRGGEIRYRLDIALSERRTDLGIRKDQTATRTNYTLTARLALVDLVTNKVVYRAETSTTNSYNILEAQFATVAAEIDSVDRAARTLADNIRLRIAAFLARQSERG